MPLLSIVIEAMISKIKYKKVLSRTGDSEFAIWGGDLAI